MQLVPCMAECFMIALQHAIIKRVGVFEHPEKTNSLYTNNGHSMKKVRTPTRWDSITAKPLIGNTPEEHSTEK